MKLLTKSLLDKLPMLYETEYQDDPVIVAKFFTPWSNWTWYATEYSPDERVFYGFIRGLVNEWGYFSLDELETIRGPYGLQIERDLYFDPVPLSEALREGR